MAHVDTEVVVFLDANVMYDGQALRKLVRNFKDPRVGAVSGRVLLLSGGVSYGAAEERYYGIEHYIQAKEGETGRWSGLTAPCTRSFADCLKPRRPHDTG